MGSILREVEALPGYRLRLCFENGSSAEVNLEKRVKTLRFARLAPPEVFATARADSDQVVWRDGGEAFRVYCSELLDAMLMD